MTDVEIFLRPGTRARSTRRLARPRSRAIDGGDTKSPTDGVDASNREDDEKRRRGDVSRVFEDISREDVEMERWSSRVRVRVVRTRARHRGVSRRGRRRERAAGERACEICLRPLGGVHLARSIQTRARRGYRCHRSFGTRESSRRATRRRSRSIARRRRIRLFRARAVRAARGRVRRVRARATRERFALALIVLGALVYARVVRPM